MAVPGVAQPPPGVPGGNAFPAPPLFHAPNFFPTGQQIPTGGGMPNFFPPMSGTGQMPLFPMLAPPFPLPFPVPPDFTALTDNEVLYKAKIVFIVH